MRLTDFPVKYDDMIMLESSPPLTCKIVDDDEIKSELILVPFNSTLLILTTRVLFIALVTHITAAMCSLVKGREKAMLIKLYEHIA